MEVGFEERSRAGGIALGEEVTTSVRDGAGLGESHVGVSQRNGAMF